MHQFIYTIAALGLTMVLTLTMSHGSRQAAHRIYINEAVTQISGVAYDVLEDIQRQGIAFDERTDESRYAKPIQFPLVRKASDLTPKENFGGCSDYSACRDIDDFDGLEITRTTQDYTYQINLAVSYVNEAAPTEVSGTQTFAKKIEATVTHPSIVIGGKPLTVTISRVITYHRVTQKSGVWL